MKYVFQNSCWMLSIILMQISILSIDFQIFENTENVKLMLTNMHKQNNVLEKVDC